MKRCPSCQATYPDTQSFCTNDGTPLVDDAPPSDLAQTLVAQPPPQQQGYGGDVPPTQAASPNPQYENQPPPLPQPPPYAPQPPQAAYAPQYQQPYTQQGYGAPKSRKMLYIGIAAAVVLAAGVVVLILVLRSGGSSALGTYKGALTDLLPNVASGYSRKSVGSLDDVARGMDRDARRFFGYDDAKAGNYEHEGKKMLIVAANFPSPDSAKAAFNKAKDEIARAAGQRTRWKIEDSGTRKNGGERAVYTLQPEPSSPEMTIVMWTNGSVVFAAGPAAVFAAVRESDFESSIPSRADVVDIEKSFPY